MLGIDHALTIDRELQADCFAGAYAQHALRKGFLQEGDVTEAVVMNVMSGDPIEMDETVDGAHGSSDYRVTSFMEGYLRRASPCLKPEPLITDHSRPGDRSSDGVVAVVRLDDLTKAAPLAEALVAGGVRAVEFTFTNPAAAGAITAAREALGARALIGAGSVLDPETARVAILAGAAFVVTPTLSLATITICHRYGVPTVIGALTPTEILTAWEGGATYVKVFPASLGGPAT